MPKSPLDTLNMFGKAAHAKQQKVNAKQPIEDGTDGDEEGGPAAGPKFGAKKPPKQLAAIKAKGK